MKDLGVTTTAQMRAVAASDLLTHTNDIGEYTLDGYVFPKTYTETLATGAQIDVPFLTGNNKDESRATPGQTVELATHTADAQTTYGSMAEEFLKLYPAANATQAGEQTNASIDDERVSTFLWGRQWSAHATSPVYNYYWTHTPPGQESQGASHGSELNYTFNNLYATDLAWTDRDRKIADTLSDYVVNFATTGNPNGTGLPRWQALDVERPGVMEVGDSFGRVPLAPTTAKIDFFERHFASRTQEW
ncbi:carboxylesterase family protein [Streptomyces sp. NPDC005423]|uniref:carboxylesterase family protein n=1 Tax=Streptomyces sp. NPDC005423 TaxID=3155343 RepID=UPI0033B37F06